MWGTWRTRSFQFKISCNITKVTASHSTACLLQCRWFACTISRRRVRMTTTWIGNWAIRLVIRWLISGRMIGMHVCHVRSACIGDCSRSLTSEKGVRLQLRMHGYITRGYGKCDWIGICWRWPDDNGRFHSSPWVHHPHLLLILVSQVINLRFQWSFLISKLVLFLCQLQVPVKCASRCQKVSVADLLCTNIYLTCFFRKGRVLIFQLVHLRSQIFQHLDCVTKDSCLIIPGTVWIWIFEHVADMRWWGNYSGNSSILYKYIQLVRPAYTNFNWSSCICTNYRNYIHKKQGFTSWSPK